jgi:serine/threonine protein phosphatase PrpC
MKALGVSNQGLVRTNNEDWLFIDEEAGLLVVADGMGGHAGGEEASRLAVDTVVEVLAGGLYPQPEESIHRALAVANRAIIAKAAANPALAGMGTTLTLVAVLPDFLITGHIGDSRAFLIGREGRCLTSDHSVTGQLLASGKITDAEAVSHPQRHVLTRALGTDTHVEAEVLRHPWSPGQHVLLCSDGLTEVVAVEEIFTVVQGEGDLQLKVNSLLSTALERGAPDNVTIILAQL